MKTKSKAREFVEAFLFCITPGAALTAVIVYLSPLAPLSN